MDDPSQTPEELAAHFGPDGPVAAARRWLETVIVIGDWESAWALMTPTLRLVRSQAWLWNNRELFENAAESLEDQAAMLASVPSKHPFWSQFAELEIEVFRDAMPVDAFEKVGVASRPRPLAPGLELVLFIPMASAQAAEGGMTDPDGAVWITDAPQEGVEVATFAQIVVEHGESGWLVASHTGDPMPMPGWPPTI